MSTYYNEFDKKTAAWLRELIAEGLIAPGYVDERSILDVRPHELTPYVQQHFFAGIGGWSYALRLAEISDSTPVRTGSCPCQPFSIAGQGLGTKDERHLWPAFRDLITFGEPTITFGEQVASPDGREWLAGVRADLEGLGYEVGAADLCAAGVGSPHPRQRLYWMAYPGHAQRRPRNQSRDLEGRNALRRERQEGSTESGERGQTCGLVLPNGTGRDAWRQGAAPNRHGRSTESAGGDGADGLEHAPSARCNGPLEGTKGEAWEEARMRVPCAAISTGPWSDFDVLQFRDLDKRGNPKLRRVEAGTFPLAARLPGGVVPSGPVSLQESQEGGEARVARLRGYGNSIVPQLAAIFIKASLDAMRISH